VKGNLHLRYNQLTQGQRQAAQEEFEQAKQASAGISTSSGTLVGVDE